MQPVRVSWLSPVGARLHRYSHGQVSKTRIEFHHSTCKHSHRLQGLRVLASSAIADSLYDQSQSHDDAYDYSRSSFACVQTKT